MENLKYFVGIKVAQFTFSIVISQRCIPWMYWRKLERKPIDTLMDPNVKFASGQESHYKIRKLDNDDF